MRRLQRHQVHRWAHAVGREVMLGQPDGVVAGLVHHADPLQRPSVHLLERYAPLGPTEELQDPHFHRPDRRRANGGEGVPSCSGTLMAKLIYSAITSLDGYIADAKGEFGWGRPDDEVHAFINDLERPIGTYLYGRRLYDVMAAWETMGTPDEAPLSRDFAAIWQAADKVVFSRTLAAPSTRRTRIVRHFDAGDIATLKHRAGRDLTIGGAELAAHAIRSGLVDEWHLFVNPVVVGGGTPGLPPDVHVDLELLDEHRFG